MHRTAPEGHRVLITAPYGRDAESVALLLRDRGYDALICSSLTDLARSLDEHAGAILITEEALANELGTLRQVLEDQPAWSDIPFILLAGRRKVRPFSAEVVRGRLPANATNVVLLERPLSTESLLSAIASAMRARQKQFQMRDQVAALDAERRRLSTLLENLPVGVAFVGPTGDTQLVNPAFRRFSIQDVIPSLDPDGRHRWEAYDASGERLTSRDFPGARSLRGEMVQGVEFLFHAPDETNVWTRVSGVPLKDDDGTVVGAISVIVDIDQQKRAQEALIDAARNLEAQVAARTADLESALDRLTAEAAERERAEAALRQAQKMEAVGQLTGGIAHDFNNMLTGVIGALDIMRRRIASERYEDLDRFMDAAAASAQRAANLIARLLAFSRRQSLDSRAIDINKLILSLDELLRRTMTERVEVSINPANDIPAGVVDANQLESAVINLAINARDAMPDGGKLIIETHEAKLDDSYCATHPGVAPGRYVVVSVTDSGVGMDKDTLDKVFDPFFTTKPIGQGTGLGLSMVYGFAKQSNGQVRVHSAPGTGTTVSIYLPAADGAREEQPGGDTAIVREGDGQTVLLVEDDDSVRLLVREVLEELGYRTFEAAEPASASDLLRSGQHFDLMVSDVGLPGMNGRQLAEIAREHHPDLPILFVTGYAENAANRAGFLGANMAMITKPFQIEMLSAKISEMLGTE
ncbi:PAS domain-containing hybrid sensor histidine kinase/response regulator [Flavisphingomonas formosensis]|uniref:PAS domain-containing hybrid sensor histidine kinase/response regulator n=1 Tax=Flavisphingomonas formosensis TaxID=861534 RepID=UPI001E480327|nr:PAS domain-containing hybrid sensor histidine kinase/response regulator [Sphingomonas formosensis]